MSNKAYYFGDANAIARLMKKMYLGLETEVPVYEEREVTTTKQLSVANLEDFFAVTNGTGSTGWTVSDVSAGKIKLSPNNIGVNSSTATITLKATQAFTMVWFNGTSWVTEENYDKLSVVLYKSNGVLDVRYANEVSGTSDFGSGYGKSMEAGGYITLTYVKDSSGHATNESVTVVIECQDSITTTTTEQVQVGTENKELARKVIRAYQPDADGKAQLWFDADAGGTSVTFTGAHTVQDVTVDGVARKLYTLTGDGVLTVSGTVSFFMIGGGSSGESARMTRQQVSSSYVYVYQSGNGGPGGHVASGSLSAGIWQITIGTGGTATTSSDTVVSHDGGDTTAISGTETHTAAGATLKSGGTGGGSGAAVRDNSSSAYARIGGTGDSVSTIPFGLADILGKPGGGGGGGGLSRTSSKRYSGGAGGSNGGNGLSGSANQITGGTGGSDGGGKGGVATNAPAEARNGAAGTAPGSGGGGGAWYTSNPGTGGAGADGAVWLLV